VSELPIIFTYNNWEIYQDITFYSNEDEDLIDGRAIFQITSNSFTKRIITLQEVDNDYLVGNSITLFDALPNEFRFNSCFSPDGEELLYGYSTNDKNCDIMTLNLINNQVNVIESNIFPNGFDFVYLFILNLSWSPDGNKIAYNNESTENKSKSSNIFYKNLNTEDDLIK